LGDLVTKKRVNFFMVFVAFWSSVSTASPLSDLGSIGDIKMPAQASEYMFRSSPKESLISVQLLGAVQKPGVYYVPSNTDLLKVLTLAGGSTNGGDISEVMVRKAAPEKWASIQSRSLAEHRGAYEVDVQELIRRGGGGNLTMNHDDLVYVPLRESLFSPETAKTVTLVSVVMSIALSGLLISKYSHGKE
jgi:hypothetical protein